MDKRICRIALLLVMPFLLLTGCFPQENRGGSSSEPGKQMETIGDEWPIAEKQPDETGNEPSTPGEQEGADRDGLPMPGEPAADRDGLPLRMEVAVPDHAVAGQAFKLSGTLWNEGDASISFQHGAGMFKYDVFDAEGNRMKLDPKIRTVNDIGYVVEVAPHKSYRYGEEDNISPPNNHLVLEQPGDYTIIGTAEFATVSNGERIEHRILSEPVRLKVGEKADAAEDTEQGENNDQTHG